MKRALIFLLFLIIISVGCSKSKDNNDMEKSKDNNEMVRDEVTLTLGAYTVPKEAYEKEIIPAFKRYWKEKTGQDVRFYESYIASGAQSRAIAGGFEADIAALSLEQDIDRLKDAGLITHEWKMKKCNGFITRSVVVIGFRPGNPKNIKGWEDLARDDVSVLYPSPKTSGGAMWAINAIYGAGLKLTEVEKGVKDESYARGFLKSIQKRVRVMDNSGRASITTFETGIGDALITYENEALLRQKQGKDFPFIVPDATILIENPVAVIDKNVDKHNNRAVAEAFVEFLHTKEAQNAFAVYGFRPVDDEVMEGFAERYPVPIYLFDINYLGGWGRVEKDIFGQEGIWTKIVEELAKEG
ncbi:sulfate ABC transporter substrate-binding protein [bacterium]|nr:sulfate ABC transporter substrate-binding protein [bacterium]